jgi:hypothetical protein
LKKWCQNFKFKISKSKKIIEFKIKFEFKIEIVFFFFFLNSQIFSQIFCIFFATYFFFKKNETLWGTLYMRGPFVSKTHFKQEHMQIRSRYIPLLLARISDIQALYNPLPLGADPRYRFEHKTRTKQLQTQPLHSGRHIFKKFVFMWKWRGMRPHSKEYPVKRLIPISRSDRVVQLY